MTLVDAISQRIKNLLEEKDITQDIWEKRCKIKKSVMENILNAKYKDINLDDIYKICDGFGIKLVEFFKDELFNWENIELL